MDLGVRWKLHGDGHTPAPGAALRAFAPAHLKAGRPLLDEGTSDYDEAGS